MLALALMLVLQVTPPVDQIVEPYTFREDQGQTTKVILKNGLTVILREQNAVPLANITTYVKAGYFDEDDRVSGISHVIEHMFFKGTAKRPVGEIARETKALGGYLNAYTYYDRTVYYTAVPAENILAALDVQADALWRSSFDAAELKREIEVVLQENNRKLDNPSAVASEKLYSIAFEQHRMRRWRIGTAEGLRALTRDDVVNYYTRYYQPSNIILSIVGQIDRERMIAEVVKLYGGVENHAVERDTASPVEAEQTAPRYGSQRGAIEQPHLAVGFHTPGVLSPDARDLEVLAAILGEGRASRLTQYLRDEEGLVTSASAGVHAFRDVGFFEIDAESNTPVEAQIGILAEIENIKKYGVTREAVGRAKAVIAQSFLHRLETIDGVADDLAVYEALGDWKQSASYLADIESVTPARVTAAAKKYLTDGNLSAFEYLPESATRSLSPDAFAQTVLAKVAAAPAANDERKAVELSVDAAIPKISDDVEDLVKPVQKRSVLRGPDVYVLEDHRLPLVSFGIFYPGGRLLETPKNSGITQLMLRTALRGTKRLKSTDIARRLENAGARIRVVNEADFFGYILEAISGKVDQALEVLMDVLQQPQFDEQEVERERVLQLAGIRNLRDNNYAYPVSLFMRTLFGEHPYARPAVGTEEAVQKVSSADLQVWFKQNQRNLMPVIVIAGDTVGTSLIASISDALTNVDLTTRGISTQPAPDIRHERQETVEPASRQQTAIVWGFPGVARGNADRAPLVVLENIVSGLGGRFFDAIREKQCLAYTVRTDNTFFARSGAVYTYTACSPEKESEVRAALEKEIEKLRKDGVTADEVKKAIAYSVGEYELGLQTRDSRVLEYARAVISGVGVPSAAKYSDAIRDVTADQVKAAILQYLDPSVLRVAVVRGTKK